MPVINQPYTFEETPPTGSGGATGTKPGLTAVTGQDTGKVVGSAGNDRLTIYDLIKDNDQVVKLGAGSDVFVFGVNDTNTTINAIVDLGTSAGDNDAVLLTHSVNDYSFILRADGGIKIQYVGPDGTVDGAAVTIRNAEEFVFRNIDVGTNVDHADTGFSYAQLLSFIDTAGIPS